MKKEHDSQPQQHLENFILSLQGVLSILEEAMEKIIAKSSWLPVSYLPIQRASS